MSATFTLARAALLKLLDLTVYPNPDDPNSPVGPVTRDLTWVVLNPQPLPPVAGPFPDPWRLPWVLLNPQRLPPVAGPSPDPWHSAFLARTVIDQAVAQYRSAEALSAGEQSERTFEAIRSSIREFVDDYCGTVPRRWPLPWPWPIRLDTAQLEPLNLLVAGAQFQKAADALTDSPLQADFSAAADQLFETGLRRMESA